MTRRSSLKLSWLQSSLWSTSKQFFIFCFYWQQNFISWGQTLQSTTLCINLTMLYTPITYSKSYLTKSTQNWQFSSNLALKTRNHSEAHLIYYAFNDSGLTDTSNMHCHLESTLDDSGVEEDKYIRFKRPTTGGIFPHQHHALYK